MFITFRRLRRRFQQLRITTHRGSTLNIDNNKDVNNYCLVHPTTTTSTPALSPSPTPIPTPPSLHTGLYLYVHILSISTRAQSLSPLSAPTPHSLSRISKTLP